MDLSVRSNLGELKKLSTTQHPSNHSDLQTGTTLLITLPIGLVICFLDLLGARVLARSEVSFAILGGRLGYDKVYAIICGNACRRVYDSYFSLKHLILMS